MFVINELTFQTYMQQVVSLLELRCIFQMYIVFIHVASHPTITSHYPT
jgi:hypothetical protein